MTQSGTARSRLPSAAGAAYLCLAWVSAALACDTRDVALGTASFNSCGTPWVWTEPDDIGDVYSCQGPGCGTDTVLRITRVEMNAEDAQLSREALLRDWQQRIIPREMNGFRFEMMAPISIETFGLETGIYIPLRVTNPDGDPFNSLAFRVPLDGSYLVVNATGKTDTHTLRGFLEAAVNNMSIAGEYRK